MESGATGPAADKAIAAIDQQLQTLQDLMGEINQGWRDRFERWKRITREMLVNRVSPSEGDAFQRVGRLTQMPAFGEPLPSPQAVAENYRVFLTGLRADIAASPNTFFPPLA